MAIVNIIFLIYQNIVLKHMLLLHAVAYLVRENLINP